ncbi:hypothetical protein BC828DRAFT_382212 [Blastocladiella britannica]|nr:hypothetical protein BC828DRAFT_382212 [Blastocladiella britannica]
MSGITWNPGSVNPIHGDHPLGNLESDFKNRMLFMFSAVGATAFMIMGVFRVAQVIYKRQNEYMGDSNSSERNLKALCRLLELTMAAMMLAMDVMFLNLTYDSDLSVMGDAVVAVSSLTLICIFSEPLVLQIVTVYLLLLWFPQDRTRVVKIVATMAALTLVPLAICLSLLAGTPFLVIQWLAFMFVCAFNVLNVVVLRFFFFWITSRYPTMAYNEVNSTIIQGKVTILYISALLDAVIMLSAIDQPFAINMVINLLLVHIKFGVSLGLSINLSKITRPVLPEYVKLLESQSEVAPGLLRPRTMSHGAQVRNATKKIGRSPLAAATSSTYSQGAGMSGSIPENGDAANASDGVGASTSVGSFRKAPSIGNMRTTAAITGNGLPRRGSMQTSRPMKQSGSLGPNGSISGSPASTGILAPPAPINLFPSDMSLAVSMGALELTPSQPQPTPAPPPSLRPNVVRSASIPVPVSPGAGAAVVVKSVTASPPVRSSSSSQRSRAGSTASSAAGMSDPPQAGGSSGGAAGMSSVSKDSVDSASLSAPAAAATNAAISREGGSHASLRIAVKEFVARRNSYDKLKDGDPDTSTHRPSAGSHDSGEHSSNNAIRGIAMSLRNSLSNILPSGGGGTADPDADASLLDPTSPDLGTRNAP